MKPSPQLIPDVIACLPAISGKGILQLAEDGGKPVLDMAVLRVIDLTKTHGTDFTLERLQQLAEVYDPTIETAALNFDHDWAGPSHGWCASVEVREGILWCRYVDLSDEAVDGIRSRKYTRVSAEITFEHAATGGWYLTAVALLGNMRPAVWGMPRVSLNRPSYVINLSQEEDPPMSEKKTAKTAAAPEAETATPPAEPTPPATTEPPAPPATPATPAITEAELSAMRQGATVAARLLAENAVLKATQKIDALGKRVTPAMRKLAMPLLTALFAQAAPPTVKLAAADGKTVEAEIAETVLGILGAAPEFEALGAGHLASEDPPPLSIDVPAGSGLTPPSPERMAELDAKYNIRNSWAYRN